MELQNIVPIRQILDNEVSEAYKEEIRNTGMIYELVPPDDHRRNIAERAIQTWKNHFVSGEKFSKAGYVSICDDAEVNIYNP